MDLNESAAKKTRIIDGVILLAIVGAVLWVVLKPSASRMDGLVGQPAPQFKLRSLAGDVKGTPDYAGKTVLLDFWATWCNPCFRQMPAIERVRLEHGDRLVVLPVNVDDPSPNRHQAMQKFLDRAGLTSGSLIDDGSVQALYGVNTIPALVIIDPTGKIAYASSGVHTEKELNGRVLAAMGAK